MALQSPDSKPNLWNRNFISICTANFLLFFAFYLLLPVLPLYLRDNFSASRQNIGIILAGYTVTALIIRPFAGFIVDSYPRKSVLLACYSFFFVLFGGYIAATTILLFAITRALHGFAFGLLTVSNSTVAIDVMPSQRRGEGIGYYGVANNLAMAIGPSISMYMYDAGLDPRLIFIASLMSAGIGLYLDSTLKLRERQTISNKEKLSFDRFFLTNVGPESLVVITVSFAYGILTTYLAIYGKEEIGIESGTGLFFLLLALGLIGARIMSARWTRLGLLTINMAAGMLMAIAGFAIFVFWRIAPAFYLSALILGWGYGTMCPSFQTMFIDMAPASRRGTANSTYMTSWDVGVGAGVVIGGYVAQYMSYHAAYGIAMCTCTAGLIIFIAKTARHYKANKL